MTTARQLIVNAPPEEKNPNAFKKMARWISRNLARVGIDENVMQTLLFMTIFTFLKEVLASVWRVILFPAITVINIYKFGADCVRYDSELNKSLSKTGRIVMGMTMLSAELFAVTIAVAAYFEVRLLDISVVPATFFSIGLSYTAVDLLQAAYHVGKSCYAPEGSFEKLEFRTEFKNNLRSAFFSGVTATLVCVLMMNLAPLEAADIQLIGGIGAAVLGINVLMTGNSVRNRRLGQKPDLQQSLLDPAQDSSDSVDSTHHIALQLGSDFLARPTCPHVKDLIKAIQQSANPEQTLLLELRKSIDANASYFVYGNSRQTRRLELDDYELPIMIDRDDISWSDKWQRLKRLDKIEAVLLLEKLILEGPLSLLVKNNRTKIETVKDLMTKYLDPLGKTANAFYSASATKIILGRVQTLFYVAEWYEETYGLGKANRKTELSVTPTIHATLSVASSDSDRRMTAMGATPENSHTSEGSSHHSSFSRTMRSGSFG